MKKPAVRAAFETLQFFEVDLPEGMSAEDFSQTEDFRKTCAEMIINGFIEFKVERLFDESGEEVWP